MNNTISVTSNGVTPNILRINSINEYKSIISNSTLNDNITKSDHNTWKHIWYNLLIGLHPSFTNIDVGNLNQNNTVENSRVIYWNQVNKYSETWIPKTYLDLVFSGYNNITGYYYMHGGASFRPIIEYRK